MTRWLLALGLLLLAWGLWRERRHDRVTQRWLDDEYERAARRGLEFELPSRSWPWVPPGKDAR